MWANVTSKICILTANSKDPYFEQQRASDEKEAIIMISTYTMMCF